MLEVKEINQFYGGSHILRDVSFQAPVGECSVVLGRNGVGKTTLLKCLMGILPIKSGQILLDGKDIAKLSPEQRVRAGLAYVPQGRDIFSTLTVEENILIGMAKFSGAKTRKVPSYLYEIFPVLDEMKHRRGGDLSGGQQQQLAIARALASEPRVLILDEPTAGVDIELRRSMWDFLTELNQNGTSIILTTHYLEEAEMLCRRIAIIDRGEIKEDTSMKSFLNQLSVETFIFDLAAPIEHIDFNIIGFQFDLIDSSTLQVTMDKAHSINDLFAIFEANGIVISSMRNKANRLEELFVNMVEKNLTGANA